MAPARSFQDLIVWQKAYQFVLGLYRLTDSFPKARDLWVDESNAKGCCLHRC